MDCSVSTWPAARAEYIPRFNIESVGNFPHNLFLGRACDVAEEAVQGERLRGTLDANPVYPLGTSLPPHLYALPPFDRETLFNLLCARARARVRASVAAKFATSS